jgi:hypothetical protein
MVLLIDEIYSEDSLSDSRECASAYVSEGAHVSEGVTKLEAGRTLESSG